MRTYLALTLAVLLMVPATAMAAASIDELQQQIKTLQEELEDMSDRVDANEKKTALDRINWYGDFRTEADSLHYQDVTLNLRDPATGMPLMNPDGTFQRVKFDRDNDILYTTRLRLGMKANVSKNVSFAGRLLMYKNWGDSTGVQVFDGFDAVTMDGTNSGNPTGDWLRVERAYFDWKDIGGSNFYLSIGRRPSTYGIPTNYRENELRGGTPSGHLVNFNFDGITVGYKLAEVTGVEGQVVRFCYGQGYESEFGNGTMASPVSDIDDVHLGGFNVDVLNDGTNFLQLTAFEALEITDAFKGIAAVPAMTSFGTVPVVTRLQATENLGNMTLAGIGFAREEMNGINWFASFGWNRTDPNGRVSKMGFGGLLTDVPGDTEAQNGYSVYTGVQVPAWMGKAGLEYNFGSKYWFAFTQAQDDLIGSKLATRGHVGEAYYIFDINPNMFIKLGGIYYNYQYTGSGVPVGKPKAVDDVQDGKAFSPFAVADTAWDAYASLTVKF